VHTKLFKIDRKQIATLLVNTSENHFLHNKGH
jgi:hypothetical protein